jgi:hypothetical protein
MTDKQTHTPGPWRAFISNGVIAVVTGGRHSHKGPREVIKWTGFDGSDFPEHAIANSFLIAAAPKMLHMLRVALADMELCGRGKTTTAKQLRETIAEAEGASA